VSDDIARNPTPEEQERILRPGLPPTGPVERFATWTSPPVDMTRAPTEDDMRVVLGSTSITGGIVTMENGAAVLNADDEIVVVVDSVAPGEPPPLEIGAVDADDYVPPDGARFVRRDDGGILVFDVSDPRDEPSNDEAVASFARAITRILQARDERIWGLLLGVPMSRPDHMDVLRGFCDVEYDSPRRPIEEIRARAATSRYWAQRLRWLRKRGRA
jgi:hypothetical protein